MFSRILVPLDQSALAEQATGTAAAIARASKAEIGLVLAHEMAPYDGVLAASWSDAKTPEESIYVRTIAEELAKGANLTVDGCVETGNPVDVICRRAREIDADLIVMTSHGRTGFSRMWLGSVADGVVREASVPVLMLRPMDEKHHRLTEAPLFHRILVPLDGSAASSAILAAAGNMARASGGTLVLARVITPIPLLAFTEGMSMYPTAIVDEDATEQVADTAREELDDLARSLERDGLKVETDVVIGERIANAILEMAKAKSADLIALTTNGRGASRFVVGSVADKILRASHLPLLLLHPQAPGRASAADGRPLRATA